MLLFCYGHPCIYESFCCHTLICTFIVFDIANYCMSSDGKRLSSLKKRKKKSQSSYLNLGEPAVLGPSGASASPSPHHHLQPRWCSQGSDRALREDVSGKILPGLRLSDALCWIFFPYLSLSCNFKAMHGKFFQKLLVGFFLPVPRFRYPPVSNHFQVKVMELLQRSKLPSQLDTRFHVSISQSWLCQVCVCLCVTMAWILDCSDFFLSLHHK